MLILDGKLVAAAVKETLKAETNNLLQSGKRAPQLAAILVGSNGASETYVASKVKNCEEIGFTSLLVRFDEAIDEATVLQKIAELNADDSVDGILVQLPLPSHIDAQRVIEAISPMKDVDGFHISSAGALMTGSPGFWPCTPYGCMKMLESINYDLKGKHAVVIGRSNIVGKPMALMLLQKNATVTICHSHTPNLAQFTREADLVVAAVGVRNILTREMVKPGAVVLDVGMNRDENGKLCGDVDFDGVSEVASFITPVPGGVGPMTITMLLNNTVWAAEQC